MFFCLMHSYCISILLINVKMPTIVDILTCMSRIQFMLTRVEYEKYFTTSEDRKCQNHRQQTNAMHREEETQNTSTQMTAIKHNQSKGTSSLLLSKINAKLKRKLRIKSQSNLGLIQNPHRQWEQIHRTRTEVTEATADGGLDYILLAYMSLSSV